MKYCQNILGQVIKCDEIYRADLCFCLHVWGASLYEKPSREISKEQTFLPDPSYHGSISSLRIYAIITVCRYILIFIHKSSRSTIRLT